MDTPLDTFPAHATLRDVRIGLEDSLFKAEREANGELRELRRSDPGTWTRRSALRRREVEVGFTTPGGEKVICSLSTMSGLRLSDIREAQTSARKAGASEVFLQGAFDAVADRFDRDSDYTLLDPVFVVMVAVSTM